MQLRRIGQRTSALCCVIYSAAGPAAASLTDPPHPPTHLSVGLNYLRPTTPLLYLYGRLFFGEISSIGTEFNIWIAGTHFRGGPLSQYKTGVEVNTVYQRGEILLNYTIF